MKEIYNEYYYVLREEINLDDFFKELFSIKNKNTDSEVIVINIGKQNFDFQYNDKNYKCYYEAIKNYKDEAIISLKIGIYYEKNKEQAAKILSEVLLKIEKNRNNKFYSIAMEDNLSMYYSQRTFKYLSVYERSIRKLIISIFVPLYSKDWSKEILSPDRKGAGTKESIEKGLERLSLSDLENLLSKKRFYLTSDNFNEVFNVKAIKEMDKEELVQIIENNKPYSLWDKYFSKYAMVDNPEKIMKEIRKERDKIAHHRYFSKQSYEIAVKNLNYLIPKIQKANNNILSHHNRDMIIDFASIIKQIPSIVKEIQASFKAMIDAISSVKVFWPKTEMPKFTDYQEIIPKIEMPKLIDYQEIIPKIEMPKINNPELKPISKKKGYSNIYNVYLPNYAKFNYLCHYSSNPLFLSKFVELYGKKNEK